MEVILTTDIPSLGKVGELVKVKDGYGRNYLIPHKKALLANVKNVQAFEAQKRMIAKKCQESLHGAKQLAEKLSSVALVIEKEVGEQDRLFGSVTKQDIVDALAQQGIELDKHILELAEPIKNLGEFTISAKLYTDVIAQIKLSVVARNT